MALKAYYQLAGIPAAPQFRLRDHLGRDFGVVEYYETDRSRPSGYMLLELIQADASETIRPLVWFDLKEWKVLIGKGKHCPDEEFEPGLDLYMQTMREAERIQRRDRAHKAYCSSIVELAGKGYTIAFQEMFPEEVKRDDLPVVEMGGKAYLVDDQYDMQPGEYNKQVTLVFIAPDSTEPAKASDPKTPLLIAHWVFGIGYDIVTTTLPESYCHQAVKVLSGNAELEKIYRDRLRRMRREGALLDVKPKPYTPKSKG